MTDKIDSSKAKVKRHETTMSDHKRLPCSAMEKELDRAVDLLVEELVDYADGCPKMVWDWQECFRDTTKEKPCDVVEQRKCWRDWAIEKGKRYD